MSEVYVASGAQSLNWMAGGACRQADPELFFPASSVTSPGPRQVELAKAVCASCPVRAACLAYAMMALWTRHWLVHAISMHTNRNLICRVWPLPMASASFAIVLSMMATSGQASLPSVCSSRATAGN